MFIDIVKLGIKDIIKYSKIFCLFEILIASISIIMISATLSIFSSVEGVITTSISYSAIPISYTEDISNISNNLNEIFENGGYSLFSSSYLNEKFNSNILVLLGQYEKNSNSKVIWCVPKNFSNDEMGTIIKISPDSIDEKSINLINFKDILDNDNIELIKPNSMKFKHINDYKLIDVELISMIENTKFNDIDRENNLDIKFEKIFENTSLYLHKNIFSNKDEVHFIVYYVFIYVFLLVTSICISFIIFIQNLYKKMHKEYIIHLICGANKISIFIRNSVFVVFLITINFLLINHLNNFTFNIILIINIILSLIFIIFLELTTLSMLLKENLTASLQGE